MPGNVGSVVRHVPEPLERLFLEDMRLEEEECQEHILSYVKNLCAQVAMLKLNLYLIGPRMSQKGPDNVAWGASLDDEVRWDLGMHE